MDLKGKKGTEEDGAQSGEDGHAAEGFVTATHADLYAEDAPICDGCGAPLSRDDARSARNAGGPALLWLRGDNSELETRPLCVDCAGAVGVSAMRSWALDDGADD